MQFIMLQTLFSKSLPLDILHPIPIKTQNLAAAHNCNSHFPPLCSAQIQNISAKNAKSASFQTYCGPSVNNLSSLYYMTGK